MPTVNTQQAPIGDGRKERMKKPAQKPAAKAPQGKAPPGKAVAVTKKPGTQVAGKMSMMERADRDSGKGVSTSADDNVVPIVRLLQDLSPQAKKNNPNYIKGATPGDIWLKDNPTGEVIIKGEVGFLFQACNFSKDIVEWRPRDEGGGFVRRWDSIPPDAKEHVDEKNGRTYYTRKGNDLVDTRYHAGFIINEKTGEAHPWVLPMKGTNHAVSRSWMPMMNSKRLPSGKKCPAWFWIWRIKSKSKTNAAGQDFFIYEVEEVREIETDEEYDRGEALYAAFESGAKKAEDDAINDSPVVDAGSGGEEDDEDQTM